LSNVVFRIDPFQYTLEVDWKFEPRTLSENCAPPASAEFGLRLEITGSDVADPMLNVNVFDVPPPGVGLKTVIVAPPWLAISPSPIAALSCVGEINVVVRVDPFHNTWDDGTKFVPVMDNWNAAPPATADGGVKVVAVGTGLLTVNANVPELPPPGGGLVTEI
jgi:hypothetical protein